MRTYSMRMIGVLVVAAVIVAGLDVRSARAEETLVTFRGTANGVNTSHSVDLRPGLVVVRARHAGTGNFILSLVLPTPGRDIRRGYEDSISLINHIGQYNGGAAGRVREAGTYVLDLRAGGSYEITVEQPPLAQVAEADQVEFSGTGQQVTPVVLIPVGSRRITFTHDGSAPGGRRGHARVWLYDMEGNTVSGDIYGRLFNEFDAYSGAVELEIILEGAHIFHVDASGAWTVQVE